ALKQALLDAEKQAKSNTKGIRGNEQAHIDNEKAIIDAIAAWNDLNPEVQRAEGKFRATKKEIIKTAVEMGVNRSKARALIEKYMEIPPKVETDAKFYDHDARRKLNYFKDYANRQLDGIRDEKVNVKLSAKAHRSVTRLYKSVVGMFRDGGEV